MRDPAEVFIDISKNLQDYEDGAAKAALVTDALGKSGTDLMPFLNDAAGSIDNFKARTQEAVDQAARFQDQTGELRGRMRGLATDITTGTLPAVNDLLGAFIDTAKGADGLLEKDVSSWADDLGLGLARVVDVAILIPRLLSAVAGSFKAVAADVQFAHTLMEYANPVGVIKARLNGTTATAEIEKALAARNKTVEESNQKLADLWNKPANEMEQAFLKRLAARGAKKDEAPEPEKKPLSYQTGNEKSEKDKERSDYEALNKAVQDRLALLQAEISAGRQLSDAEKEIAKIQRGRAEGTVHLTDVEAEGLIGQLEIVDTLQKSAAASVQVQKLYDDLAKSSRDKIAAAVAEAESNERLIDTVGRSKAEIEALTLARLEEQYAQRGSAGLTLDEIENLELLIVAKKRSAVALAEVEDLEAQRDLWKSIDDTAHQTFTSITDGGKGAAQRVKDAFKNTFFDWLYQLTLKKWIVNVGASLTGTTTAGVAGAATGSGGAGSAIGSGLGSAVGGLFGAGGLSGSLMAGAGWMTGATTFGGALGAGASLMGTGTLAGMASGLGVMAGALGPIALGVAGVMALVKKWDDSGTIHTGGAASASAAGVSNVSASTLNFQRINTADATNQMTAQLATSIVGILDSTASAFGKTAGYTAATAFADDTSKDGAWGALVIKSLDKTLVNWQDTRTSRWAPKEFADGDTGQAQYLAALGTSVRSALDSIGLPGWATSMLNALGNAPSLEQLASTIDAINATQAALVTMGQRLVGFSSMSDSAVSALIATSGGINGLATNASSYYDAFYSEGEKFASVSTQIAQALHQVGIQMPATREEFRAQVEAQMRLGESGASAVAALLGVSGAFAQIVPVTEGAAAAVEDLSAQQRIATERRALEIQLMELSGDAAGALAATRFDELAALDPMNRALQELIYARQDEQAAAEKMGDIVADARSALTSAYEAEQDAINATIDRVGAYGSSLKKFRDGLLLGSLSPLTSGQKYLEAKGQFERIVALANGGDETAQGNLEAVSSAFLEASKAANASDSQYQADFLRVQQATADALTWTQQQVDVAKASLTALNQQVAGLIDVKTEVRTVAEAIRALSALLGKDGQAQVADNQSAALESLYQSILGRASDADGKAYWTEALKAGHSMAQIAEQFRSSTEYQAGAKIDALYKTLLGRDADAEGRAFWIEAAKAGATISQIADEFRNSIEYQAQSMVGSNQAAAIEKLYQGLLGRSSDADGMAYWTERLDTGTSIAQVIKEFRTSAEFQQSQVPFAAPVVSAAPIDYRGFGTTGMTALVEEVKRLRTERDETRSEVAQLRADMKEHVGQLIKSNYDANNRAAQAVADGSRETARTAAYQTRTKATLE
ncbi:MAG TPA: DUF4214 domain-containing protein [Pseudoduganella sp.]